MGVDYTGLSSFQFPQEDSDLPDSEGTVTGKLKIFALHFTPLCLCLKKMLWMHQTGLKNDY
jgi:hypothetical protein